MSFYTFVYQALIQSTSTLSILIKLFHCSCSFLLLLYLIYPLLDVVDIEGPRPFYYQHCDDNCPTVTWLLLTYITTLQTCLYLYYTIGTAARLFIYLSKLYGNINLFYCKLCWMTNTYFIIIFWRRMYCLRVGICGYRRNKTIIYQPFFLLMRFKKIPFFMVA